MLTLNLKEVDPQAALVLAAMVADQTAVGLGLNACVTGLDEELAVELPGASDRLLEVFVAHLSRSLGEGFSVLSKSGTVGGERVVTVAPEAVEDEAQDTSEAVEDAPEALPRRRGRPPGSKTRTLAEP
jgi:hypothetical protein